MAVVKNKTGDTLAIGRPDAPPVDPGGEVTIADERFAESAWPTETWELVEPPGDGYVDESLEDAYLFVPAPEKPAKKTAAKKTTAKKGDS